MRKKNKEAIDSVVKMTEIESLTFGKLDAEIRNAIQGIQLANYRKQDAQREFEEKCKKEEENIAELNALIRKLKPEYDEFLDSLVEKYEISDKSKMSIDPDTRIIREI